MKELRVGLDSIEVGVKLREPRTPDRMTSEVQSINGKREAANRYCNVKLVNVVNSNPCLINTNINFGNNCVVWGTVLKHIVCPS